MELEIVRAVDGDLDGIMALVCACVAHMRAQGVDQWDEQYPTRDYFERDLAERTLWVGREGDTCRAVIVLNEHQDPEYGTVPWHYQNGPVVVVHRLAVDPAFQGRRIASQLMDFAEAYARSRGYAAIRLDAFPSNSRAVALYTGRGYRKAGEVSFRKGVFFVFEKALVLFAIKP